MEAVLASFDLKGERLEAATQTDRNVLVLAGPGAGKTHLLAAHAAWLTAAAQGRIVLMTFSRKAAREIQERVERGIEDSARRRRVVARTLHTHALEVLRTHGHRQGLRSDLKVIEKADVEALADECAKELGVPPLPDFGKRLERFRQLGVSIDRLAVEFRPFVAAVDQRMRRDGLVDAGGAIRWATELLQTDTQVRESVRHHDRSILLDEAQDCDPAQLAFVEQLLDRHTHLFVAMDPDQALYSWRQADPEQVLAWARRFGPREFPLTENFRCSPRIAALARHVLRGAADVVPEGQTELRAFSSHEEEANFVVGEVRDLPRTRAGLGRVAVLGRAAWRLRTLLSALDAAGVPTRSGATQYSWTQEERKAIEALTAVAEWALGFGSASGLHSLPPDILNLSSDDRLELERRAVTEGAHPIDLLAGNSDWAKLGQLAKETRTPFQLVRSLAHHLGLEQQDLERLLAVAQQSPNLGVLLRTVERGQAGDRPSDAGSLLVGTFHGAKGLEFDTVYVLGCEEGVIPDYRSKKPGEIEAERRALYVAVTRAARRAVVTVAQDGQRARSLSRFLPAQGTPFWSG